MQTLQVVCKYLSQDDIRFEKVHFIASIFSKLLDHNKHKD